MQNRLKSSLGLIFLLIFCLFSLFFPSKASAIFYKFNSAIALPVGNFNQWDSSQVYGPTVVFESGKFKMWYSGNDGVNRRIGYADSLNPFVFTKNPSNPLISSSVINNSDIGVEHPSVVNINSQYKMWLSNVEFSFQNFGLYYFTSNDGLSWSTPLNLIFDSNSTLWDIQGKGAPSIIYNSIQNIYQMWYAARGSNNNSTRWRIGYATSSDGINWAKNPTPVLEASSAWEGSDVGNPSVLFDETTGIYEMFYHGDFSIGRATSTDGINWTKDPANPILTPTMDTFDSKRVLNPYVLKKDGIFYMYYTGIGSDDKWQIGLATSEPIPTPLPTAIPTSTPSPTPTPIPTMTITPTITPTFTPTPTPTISSQTSPIIFIPGLGASWNPKDIFSCSIDSSGKWELAPYVSLYNRLIKTLTDNAHLRLNQDVYLYTYDWRQPLDKQAENFKTFLDNLLAGKAPNTKIRLIGHSLGGLVIRSYLDMYPGNHHVLSALTVGTPHMGAVDAYPIWEKGEIVNNDLLLQIAMNQVVTNCRVIKSIIFPNKSVPLKKFRNNREIVQYLVPIIKQLLPTFDYLRQKNQIKPTSNLKSQNDWIPSHPFPTDNYNTNFFTLSGENVATLRFFDVVNPSIREGVFGDWADGKPVASEKVSSGDGTILNLSSQINGANNEIISGNHTEIVSSDNGINKILNFLGMSGVPVAPAATVPEEISKSALTISLSQEAQVKITDPRGKRVEAKENIFVSYDPSVGLYRLEILPNKTTEAYLHISQVVKNQEAQTRSYSLVLTKNRPRRFYLIYNPANSTPLNLIPV